MLGYNNDYFSTKLSVSSVNCNSLNCSVTAKNNRNLKIHGITKLATDVIFISDIRLSNKQLVSSEDEIKKQFQLNMYDGFECFFNSTRNKRGVGILINKKISYTVSERVADTDENFLLLKLSIAGKGIVLGSVYGPNVVDLQFFEKLEEGIRKINPQQDLPVIMGGDWNCTYSTDPVEHNIDVLNMRDVPNMRHSLRLNDLCEKLQLCDPYRIKHFNKVDFTYVPRIDTHTNRSRIDFFLVSDLLVNQVSKCEIKETVQNKLFDHKAILLELNGKGKRRKGRQMIDNKILSSDIVEIVVHCAVAESYVQHLTNVRSREALLQSIGQLKLILFNLGLHWTDRPGDEVTEDEASTRERLLDRARYILVNLDTRVLENAEINCDPDVFMEVLVNNVRNDTCSYQSYFMNEKKKKFQEGIASLRNLKSNYVRNLDRIRDLEKKLNDAVDMELRADLERFYLFEHIESEKVSPKFLQLAKNSAPVDTMSGIKDDTGKDFQSPEEMKQYVTDYYSKIYKEVPGKVRAYEGCIEDFLGENITNNPEVLSKKNPIEYQGRIRYRYTIGRT
jgi:exonuclease III